MFELASLVTVSLFLKKGSLMYILIQCLWAEFEYFVMSLAFIIIHYYHGKKFYNFFAVE